MLKHPEFWIAYIVILGGIIGYEVLDRFAAPWARTIAGNDLYVLLAAAVVAFGGALLRGFILRFQSPTRPRA